MTQFTEPSEQSNAAFIAVIGEAEKYLPSLEVSLVARSYRILLSTIRPENGLNDLFLQQSLATALHLTHLGLSSEYLASALLYYPLTTKAITLDEVQLKFGRNTTHIAKSLISITKSFERGLPWNHLSSKIPLRESQYPHAKRASRNSRRDRITDHSPDAFLAIAQVPEIAILKIVDRLHLLEWSEQFIETSLRRSLAREGIDIHAAVAEMLGIWSVKWQLEDVAFKILQSETYEAIARDLRERRQEREVKIDNAVATLRKAVARGITGNSRWSPQTPLWHISKDDPNG